MAQSVKLSDAEMEIIRKEAQLTSRSIAGQITHWIRIGRSIERAPEFNYMHICQALEGKRSPDALSREEQAVFIDALLGAVADETPQQKAFFARRRKTGRGAGTAADGKTVRQTDIKSA